LPQFVSFLYPSLLSLGYVSLVPRPLFTGRFFFSLACFLVSIHLRFYRPIPPLSRCCFPHPVIPPLPNRTIPSVGTPSFGVVLRHFCYGLSSLPTVPLLCFARCFQNKSSSGGFPPFLAQTGPGWICFRQRHKLGPPPQHLSVADSAYTGGKLWDMILFPPSLFRQNSVFSQWSSYLLSSTSYRQTPSPSIPFSSPLFPPVIVTPRSLTFVTRPFTPSGRGSKRCFCW